MILFLLALLAPADTAYRAWTYGSRVHAAFNQVYIRADSTATGRVLDSVTVGTKGTLIGGPWLAADGGQRWQVRYDPPKPTGWTRQLNLLMDTLYVPPQPPPPVPVVSGLYVFPKFPLTMAIGDEYALIGVVDSAGIPVQRTVLWSSSDTMVAVFHNPTRVFAAMAGTATLTARVGVQSLSGTVTVKGVPVQVMVLGIPIWTNSYELFPTDSTGKRTARLRITVLPP